MLYSYARRLSTVIVSIDILRLRKLVISFLQEVVYTTSQWIYYNIICLMVMQTESIIYQSQPIKPWTRVDTASLNSLFVGLIEALIISPEPRTEALL
jgi:hypothetical protein